MLQGQQLRGLCLHCRAASRGRTNWVNSQSVHRCCGGGEEGPHFRPSNGRTIHRLYLLEAQGGIHELAGHMQALTRALDALKSACVCLPAIVLACCCLLSAVCL